MRRHTIPKDRAFVTTSPLQSFLHRLIPLSIISKDNISRLLRVVNIAKPTSIAATGLGTVVLLGVIFHLARKEYRDIIVNIIFLALALRVAMDRF
ncbi:hypothetical protein DX130_18260 [Paenibacillus paeoniae]|uniref:Uncharacterized protein n=1 Tax=Paenibacillus paeoniae TaxID=2292705 RepID=A0A371PFY3_9BACL|nr:hypothetical protein DX130_18260 [Paenibacillus paeoniae]